MQYFDTANVTIVCLYCGLVNALLIYISSTIGLDAEDYNIPELSFIMYFVDSIFLAVSWVMAAIILWMRKKTKIQTFGFFLASTGFIFLMDRVLCLFGDGFYEGEFNSNMIITYSIVIAFELLITHAGMMIYKGRKLRWGTRWLIVLFMVCFIITRGTQFLMDIYNISDFIDVESSILLCIFIIASLFDEDIKRGMGLKVREDVDDLAF